MVVFEITCSIVMTGVGGTNGPPYIMGFRRPTCVVTSDRPSNVYPIFMNNPFDTCTSAF